MSIVRWNGERLTTEAMVMRMRHLGNGVKKLEEKKMETWLCRDKPDTKSIRIASRWDR